MSLKSYNFLDSSNISVLIPILDARYSIGQASNVKFGLIKLYDGTGDNIDGTMTQHAISQRLSSIYRFKGSLEDYEDLPKNPEIGDTYNIANPNIANHIKSGDNLAWNGTGWDNLSGLMDLSNYLQKNGEYIKSVSFDGELKTITFLLPDNSTESILLPSGLDSEELEVQDLDLLLNVGVYPINNLSGISNLPIQELGSLLIFSDEIFTHQLYYTLSGNFFVRVYNHSLQVWTDWSNIKTKLKQIYAETTDLFNPNFNEISLAVCSIENISSASNYPIAKNGLLQNVIGNSYSFQIYTTIDGQVFNRCKTNNTWSDWKEISPTITILTSGNLDDFIEHKTYHITDLNNAILNKPDSSQSAEFIVTSSEGYIYQKYINSSNSVYIRNKKVTDINFSEWKSIIDSSSITAYAPLNSPTFIGNAIYNATIDKSDNSKKIANTEFVKSNLSDYAPLDSAGLTGTPTLSTEISKSDNSKKIANTEFVNSYVTEILKSYAPLASPEFSGVPISTTPTTNDSSTKIATTAYVKDNLLSYAPLSSPSLTGNPTVPTQNVSDNSTRVANTEFVVSLLTHTLEDYALLDSPELTGNPTATTQLKTDSSTKIATTAYVKDNLSDYLLSSEIQSTYAPLDSPTFTGEPKSVTPLTTDNSTKIATTAYVNSLTTNKLASYAPLASPEFSGTPKVPDITAGDLTTKIANTKFVGTAITNALANYAPLNSPNLTGTPTTPDITAGTSTTQIANTKFVMTAIANLIDSAPESLNTLSELSSALNNDPSFATNVMTAIGEKLPIAGGEITGNLKVNGTLTATLSGNATSATNDSDNNAINTTYSKVADAVASLSASGTTITFKNKAGTSLGTFTTQDTHYTSKLIAGISTSTANAASTNGNTYLRLFDDSTNRSNINIKGTGATSVTSDANGVITINSTDNNTTYSTGTATTSGITKLYTGTGTNTDGTMTQSAIKSALDEKMSSSTTVTNVIQTVSTANGTYPLLAVATANQTATATAGTIFATGIKLNPSTGNITATSFTGNLTGNCSGTSANVTGTIAIANGGTGATTVANARKALFGDTMSTSALAKYVITINDSWANGGYTTVQQLRNFMGLGDTTGVLPVANGGTGANSLANITVGKATGDKNGADITTTYETKANAITGLSLSGTTLTITKGNSDTSTINLPSYYGVCSTTADTVAKTVSITGFALVTGAKATIKFSVTNTAENPTLNITSTGAKPIYYRGYPIPAEVLQANSTYDLVYNGTEYEIIGSIIWSE